VPVGFSDWVPRAVLAALRRSRRLVNGRTVPPRVCQQPLGPEVVIESNRETVESSVTKIIRELEQRVQLPQLKASGHSGAVRTALDAEGLETLAQALMLA